MDSKSRQAVDCLAKVSNYGAQTRSRAQKSLAVARTGRKPLEYGQRSNAAILWLSVSLYSYFSAVIEYDRPPNLVIDAQKAMQPYLRHPKQKAAAARAMQELFELSSAGPVFVTCYQEMQRCAMEVLRRSRPTACKVKETCAALSS